MIYSISELPNLRLDPTKCVIGLTSGCYDLFHRYHLIYLRKCAAECDHLIVLVDSDNLLTSFKNKAPVHSEHNRVDTISELRCVYAACIMHNLRDFERAINLTKCHKIFKNKAELYGKPIVMGEVKPELVVIPDVKELTSTSEMVEEIRNRV